MFHKLSNEAERFLDGDAANETDHVRIVALGNLFHCVDLVEEVGPLVSCGTSWRET